ncbi:hydantoinase/oxoprolinase family protein [Mesorhizobium sp. 1B3]|uniref:hydantoinase/oxoprolinase family protein n=1 Tax=Mesorhizobium sp. 1B3 TaxID=3243599 RepID=UPI003D975EB3
MTDQTPIRAGAGYILGADIGGTFTDLLAVREADGALFTAKVPSTPHDPSIAVLNGIERITEQHGIPAEAIHTVMHGTTVATNAVLTRGGVKVGLLTTKGFRDVLHIGRSFVPGNLGAWVTWERPEPLVPLSSVVEVDERIAADGTVLTPLDESALRRDIRRLRDEGIEALTISFLNAYVDGAHERRAREIAQEELPGIQVSISSEVAPEMYEYERTVTTVVNSYVGPIVKKYVDNLQSLLQAKIPNVNLRILRSDGGLSSGEAAAASPVNLLMSGPAGGVAGAIWVAKQAGFPDFLTFDMGGTSTDVALVQGHEARTRRETAVHEVIVRAPSIDVKTVGAGGGSIAFVPELTKALRVGPKSAGAVPGPAAYMKGGAEPTVTDANVVLGYLPADVRLGGDMKIDVSLAEKAMEKVAGPLGLSIREAAEGVIDIVNENMFGALRLVSVEMGYDPRDFALMAFGGAGPLHANALGALLQSWPVIIPPGPGVLCAYGDATTKMRNEGARSFVRRFGDTSAEEIRAVLAPLKGEAAAGLEGDMAPKFTYQADVRYCGQGLVMPIDLSEEDLAGDITAILRQRFDSTHEQLFVFALDTECELVNLRATAEAGGLDLAARRLPERAGTPAATPIGTTRIFHRGEEHEAGLYDRALLRAGDRVPGPAIVTEMDTTSLILPGHYGDISPDGSILIYPNDHRQAEA